MAKKRRAGRLFSVPRWVREAAAEILLALTANSGALSRDKTAEIARIGLLFKNVLRSAV
jgi:hypothetical protein